MTTKTAVPDLEYTISSGDLPRAGRYVALRKSVQAYAPLYGLLVSSSPLLYRAIGAPFGRIVLEDWLTLYLMIFAAIAGVQFLFNHARFRTMPEQRGTATIGPLGVTIAVEGNATFISDSRMFAASVVAGGIYLDQVLGKNFYAIPRNAFADIAAAYAFAAHFNARHEEWQKNPNPPLGEDLIAISHTVIHARTVVNDVRMDHRDGRLTVSKVPLILAGMLAWSLLFAFLCGIYTWQSTNVFMKGAWCVAAGLFLVDVIRKTHAIIHKVVLDRDRTAVLNSRAKAPLPFSRLVDVTIRKETAWFSIVLEHDSDLAPMRIAGGFDRNEAIYGAKIVADFLGIPIRLPMSSKG